MKQFLIVKTSAIGDVIQSFHIIDYLKKRFPGCEVDWVVEKGIAPLLRAHPGIRSVLEVDTKLWRTDFFAYRQEIGAFRKKLKSTNYDALFDLQGNTKSGAITALAKARQKVGYSWNSLPEKPNYFSTNAHFPAHPEKSVREGYSQLLEDFFGGDTPFENTPLKLNLTEKEECRLQRLKQLGFQRPRIMVCFGSNWKNKTLTDATLKQFLDLIDEILAPAFFFMFGNDKEKKQADALERAFGENGHAVGELSLPLWQRFMGVVECVISTDSAGLHLCGTTETPSFSLFGPSSARAYKPVGDRHQAFQGTCPYDIEFNKRCPNLRTCETGSCLREVSAEDLFEQFQAFWEKVSEPALLGTT